MSNPGSELDPASAVSVGRLLSPHGVKGDVKVHPLTAFPERFSRGSRLWLDGVQRRVERSRWQGRVVVIKLEGIDSREDVAAVAGHELLVPQPATIREEGVFYLHDIVGLEAVDVAGEVVGSVVDVLSTGSNDVYVIEGESGQLLLPAIEDVIREIDVPGRRMVVELMEGLEFQGGPKKPRRASTREKPTSGF